MLQVLDGYTFRKMTRAQVRRALEIFAETLVGYIRGATVTAWDVRFSQSLGTLLTLQCVIADFNPERPGEADVMSDFSIDMRFDSGVIVIRQDTKVLAKLERSFFDADNKMVARDLGLVLSRFIAQKAPKPKIQYDDSPSLQDTAPAEYFTERAASALVRAWGPCLGSVPGGVTRQPNRT